MRFSFRFVIQR